MGADGSQVGRLGRKLRVQMAAAHPLALGVQTSQAPMERRFNPYDYNGGTVLAIAGADYSIIAGDTRMSRGYSIMSRSVSKVFKVSDKVVLATAGMQADTLALHKLLKARQTMYMHQHAKDLSVGAFAQMLGNILYGRRFFPYYTWNVLAGIDENGVGAVYSYDPVGNVERVRVSVSGSGESLIQPLLDNQIERQHQMKANLPPPMTSDLSVEDCLDLVKDAFTSAGERDIYTGDSVEIAIITKSGVEIQKMELKAD